MVEVYQLFEETGELPDDPNERALVEYYDAFEKASTVSGPTRAPSSGSPYLIRMWLCGPQ